MIVIADSTPLNYLVLIDRAEILPQLYGRVLIPPAVWEELQRPETPEAVHAWVTRPPRGSKFGLSRKTPTQHSKPWVRESVKLSRWPKNSTPSD